jgi:YD repeat-containing protein
MKRLLFLLALLLVFPLQTVKCEQCQSKAEQGCRLTAESELLLTVADCVSVMSGDFFHVDNDLIIERGDPIAFTRFYDSGMAQDIRGFVDMQFGNNVGISYPLNLGFYPDKDRLNKAKKGHLRLEQRQWLNIPFKVKKSKDKNLIASISSKIFDYGYTNCTEALKRGEPSLVHTTMELTGNYKIPKTCSWTVSFQNGTKRYYIQAGHESHYHLDRELLPNGLCRIFSYDDNNNLKTITTKNQDGSLELSKIVLSRSGLNYSVEGSNGLNIFYSCNKQSGKVKRNGLSTYKKLHTLGKASADHFPEVNYDFYNASNCKYPENLFKVRKISWPNQRFLQVEYDSKGRVKKLLAPIGNDAEGLTLYAFEYHKHHTIVTDALGKKDTYRFSHKRLSERKEEGLRSHRYFWDKKGQLLAKALFEGDHPLECIYFQYDEAGNVIKKTDYGNITGSFGTLKLDKEGTPTGTIDRRVTDYCYSDNGLNLLLSETAPNEAKTRYHYVEGTNLIDAKYTLSKEVCHKREFFTYDKNAILIQQIVDDGSGVEKEDLADVTYRLITEITPQLDPLKEGFTHPNSQADYYLDLSTGNKVLLKRTDFTYAKGDLVSGKFVYDSDGQYAHSCHFKYNSHLKLIQEINPLGETTLYDYDANDNLILEEKIDSGKKTIYTYDYSNRLISETEYHSDGTILATRHSYDKMGNRTKTADPYGFVTQFEYDKFGRKIKEIDPYGYIELTCYDSLDNPILLMDKEGNQTETVYNAHHKPLSIKYPDGTEEKFEYYIDGNLKTKWEKDGAYVSYTYDYRDRILTTARYSKEGRQLTAEKNQYKGDLLVSHTDALGISTLYTYDNAGRKTSMIRGDITECYFYDALGRQNKTKLGDRVIIKEYDSLDRVIEERVEDCQGKLFRKKQFEYDIHGNQTKILEYESRDYIETSTIYNSQNLPIKNH